MTDKTDSQLDPALQEHLYKMLAASAMALVAAGTLVFSWLEEWSIVDSFYFSVVTITTVGFGDITPDTDGAKLFTVLYMVIGISLVGAFLDARLKKHSWKRVKSAEKD